MKTTYACVVILCTSLVSLSAQMRVHLIDVGQGSATLVEFPCAAILIDAGGEKNELFNSSDTLKAYLDEFFDRRPDLNGTLQSLYLTHPHKDHTGGVPMLLENYVIRNAVTDGLEKGSGRWEQIRLHRRVQAAEATATPDDDIGFEAVVTQEIGASGFANATIDAVDCAGTDPVIRVLWGTSTTNPGWSQSDFRDGNNHSLVIRLDYGAASMLVVGDLEEEAQQSLVTKYSGTTLLDVDVYVAGHHGSRNGTSQDLLTRMTPRIALIGMGDPQRKLGWTAWAYGHPNKGVLDRVQAMLTETRTPIEVQAGTRAKRFVAYTVRKAIYATGWDGTVVLEADAAGAWKRIEERLVPERVNINTATADELERLPGIGRVRARAIVDHRSANGPFTTVEELDDVSGIGPATIELVRPYVVL